MFSKITNQPVNQAARPSLSASERLSQSQWKLNGPSGQDSACRVELMTTSAQPVNAVEVDFRRGGVSTIPAPCALIATYLDEIRVELAGVGVELRHDAYLFSNGPAHFRPWNPDWATHKIAEAAAAAEVELDIKGGRHCTASQLLAGGFDLRNTAARLSHSGGGATTLRHYAEPVPEVDRRAAAYLAKLTARSAAQNG